MKKTILFTCVIIAAMALALGCSGVLRPLLADLQVDRVEVTLPADNRPGGRESKKITDAKEVEALVYAFDGMEITEPVPEGEEAQTSEYLFYSGDKLVARYSFGGKDSSRLWSNGAFRYVRYPDKTPYELYRESGARTLLADGGENEPKEVTGQ